MRLRIAELLVHLARCAARGDDVVEIIALRARPADRTEIRPGLFCRVVNWRGREDMDDLAFLLRRQAQVRATGASIRATLIAERNILRRADNVSATSAIDHW